MIVAGYTKEMKEFIDANPGLRSRFTRYIEFPDYSADELLEVFMRLAMKKEYRLSEDAASAVGDYMRRLVASKDRHFGNAREVRNFFSSVEQRQSERLALIMDATKKQMSEILREDIPSFGGGKAKPDVAMPVASPKAIEPLPAKVEANKRDGLAEAHLANMKSPSALVIDGVKVACVYRWKDVFQKIYEKLNEVYPSKFDALPMDPQFARYFVRLAQGQRTPRNCFKIKLGSDSCVRVKELSNKVYLWRTDYYFRKLLLHLGIDAARLAVL